MFIFSETTFAFIQKCQKMCKDILQNEMKLNVGTSRFTHAHHTYPIKLRVFEGKTYLGYFDAKYFLIAVNSKLIFQKDSIVKDILRHELAHYLCYLKFGADVMSHGHEFQAICDEAEFSSDVKDASMNLAAEGEMREGEIVQEKILTKIKALLELSKSSNEHESKLATYKANQLLLKHNLEKADIHHENESTYIQAVLSQKKRDAQFEAIADILPFFLVYPVQNFGKGEVRLEVGGPKVHVELAQYITDFLVSKLNQLWQETKNQDPTLKGLRAKNSFFRGVGYGFKDKMKESKASLNSHERKALVVVEKQLEKNVTRAYSGLRASTRRDNLIDTNAFIQGQKQGRSLQIQKGVKNKNQNYLLE